MERTPRIAVMTAYPQDDWHSRQLAEAAGRHGEVFLFDPCELGARLERGKVEVLVRGQDVRNFDLFLMPRPLGDRGDSDFQLEVYAVMRELGCLLVNEVGALLRALDKFRCSVLFEQAGLPTPETRVTQDPAEAAEAVERWGEGLVKPLYGSLGDGIERIARGDRARLEALGEKGALYVQRCIPSPGRDIRAFVVGSEVVAAMYRYPSGEGPVTNIHRGGRAEPARLGPREQALAVSAAKLVGLAYSGVDLIEGPDGPVVIEVNGTPRWEGLAAATGRDLAGDVVRYALSLEPPLRTRRVGFPGRRTHRAAFQPQPKGVEHGRRKEGRSHSARSRAHRR